MMFFIMHTLSQHEGITSVSNSLKDMLLVGSIVIGIFSVIFLFYTNSFLIKRRKKEIGLYNILGMEKRHIMKVLFYETFFVSLISLIIGVLSGLLFGNLIFMLLVRILKFMTPVSFSLSLSSIIITILLFAGIFLLTLLTNLTQIHLAKPVELLKGGNQGEKEPKTKWLIAVIGFVSLGVAYTIALSVTSPLEALWQFFIAIILVMIGTYALFTAGSIVVLKALKKKRKFYYKQNHFTAVSGMIYRMKQNAVGLANICILSSAVLVILSTTVSLYAGMEDALNNRFPQDMAIEGNYSDEFNNSINNIVKSNPQEYDVTLSNYTNYKFISIPVEQKNGEFIWHESSNSSSEFEWVVILPVSEYNRLEGKEFTLRQNEALIHDTRKEINTDTIHLNDIVLSTEYVEKPMNAEKGVYNGINVFYIVVNSEETVSKIYKSLTGESLPVLSSHIGFDINGTYDNVIDYSKAIKSEINELYTNVTVDSKLLLREAFTATYGGLFFLGIFIGTLFLMATVLIIYYKQISEGFDDKNRFEIMQKVGMSKKEVNKSIKSQILMIFFLPLVVAIIHIAFAFNVISKLLALFNFTNIPLFICCMAVTAMVFIIIYSIVYGLTAKTYYKIVS